MPIYMTVDSGGFPTGFYNDAIHGARLLSDGEANPATLIPANAVEITEAQWLEFINNQGLRQWNGSDVVTYTPPPAPPAVPQSISDRQFFQQLAVQGIITEDQALAANAAVIPAPLASLIDAMPADQQFGAKMIVSGATVFERSNPLTIAIGTAYGMSSNQIDAFFIAAAAL